MNGVSASKRATLIWSLLGLVLATQYNACSQQVLFSQSLSSLKNELLSSAMIAINQNAQFTNDTQVNVDLQNDLADEVYVTNDPTCNSGGAWEPMQASRPWTLAEMNKEVLVYARYRNTTEGISTGCVSDSIVHDNEPPAVLFNEPNMITNVNTPVINFLAWDLVSGVQGTTCKWPGQSEAACAGSTSNGNVAEGVYSIEVVAKDNAGNVAAPTLQALMVDRTPPRVILNSAPAAVTSDGNAVFAFTGQDNLSGIKNYECAREVDTAFAVCSSPVQWTVGEGPHKFFIRTTDNAGNVSAALVHEFVIDMTAPTVRILTGPLDFSNSPQATFTFDGMDDGQPITKFECRVDAGVFASCTTPHLRTGLADGEHVFYVRGQDTAGLYSAPVSRTWTVDTVAPVVKFTQRPLAVTNSVNAAFRYTITDVGSGVASAECALDSVTYVACSVSAFDLSALLAGDHTLKVRGIDKAGNKGAAASYSWKVDLTAPLLVLNSGPGQFWNSAIANFTYTASDAQSGIARVDCRLDAGAYAPCDSVSAHAVSGLQEGFRVVSIRAVDNAGNFSSEVLVSFVVDLTGPMISIFQQPLPAIPTTGSQALGFTVIDGASGVKSIACTFNGVSRDCASGVLLSFANMTVGTYKFVVVAVDNAGNTSSHTSKWEVRAPVAHTSQVTVAAINKVDIVVIIDNSGSMAPEMKSMGQYFSKFLSQLNGLDWQVGIITTDPKNNNGDAAKTDGRLVELVGSPAEYILKSSMPAATSEKLFADTIQMATDGSGNERGVVTAKRAIQRAFDGNPINAPHTALFREDAVLAFVVVSDSHDNDSTPADLINEVKAHWMGKKVFSFHSIVVPESSFTNPTGSSVDPADPCKGYRESVKFDGRVYYRLSELTGGIKGTVCSTDYGTQLADMGKATVQLINSATLECPPIDTNNDNKIDTMDVHILTSTGTPYTQFTVNGDKLVFPNGLPLGVNTVNYTCF
jgi:hypothetical protein